MEKLKDNTADREIRLSRQVNAPLNWFGKFGQIQIISKNGGALTDLPIP